MNDQPHPERIRRLKQREDARFHAARPRSAAPRERTLVETHTQVIGAGVPFGVLGMRAELCVLTTPHKKPIGARRTCACRRGRRT